MRTVNLRSLAMAAAALLAFTGSVVAQDRPSVRLNSLQVKQLVARAEPADHARLAAHFSALAEQYTAEAKRHVSMSQRLIGNPNRGLETGMRAHCTRLAELSAQSETMVRELAAYHETLASGTPATLPSDGARFEAGAGAREPSRGELDALGADAGTPAEHLALEEYFQRLTKQYTDEANEQVALAQTYRGTRIAHAAINHDRLAGLARDAARKAAAAAEMHRNLAGAVQ